MGDFMLSVKYVIVFQNDGLDIDGVKDILKKYGDIHEVISYDKEECTVFFMESDLPKYFRIKLEMYCVEPEKYILYPMENLQEKMKVLETLKKEES